MFLGRLGIYNDSQKATIQSMIAQGGANYGALPADTLLAIAAANGLRTNYPSSGNAALDLAIRDANTKIGTWGQPFVIGGKYGIYKDLRNLYSVVMGAMGIDPANYNNFDLSNTEAPQMLKEYFDGAFGGGITAYPGWIFTVDGPSNDGGYTYHWQPNQAALQQYENFFAGLKSAGKIQLMNTYWGFNEPAQTFPRYRDPTLITFDANYGLVTPASNFIAPIAPDHSLQDILMFVGIAFALYGAVSAASSLVSGNTALAQTAATPTASTTATTSAATTAATSVSEVSTAAQEALREIEMANLAGATVTQAEAASWATALSNAGLAIPANISAIASGVVTTPAAPAAPAYEPPAAPPAATPTVAPGTAISATETATSGEEALREIEFARLGGATVTQGEASGWVAALQHAGLSVPSDLAAIASGATSPSSLPRFSPETAQQFPGANSSTPPKYQAPPPAGAGGAAASPLMKLLATGGGLLATQTKSGTKATALNPVTVSPIDATKSQAQSNNWIWILAAGVGVYALSRKKRG